MDDTQGALYNKMWTTDDLRNASSNWNLAGDKALLEILQNMHQDLIHNTDKTTEKLGSLNMEISKTFLNLKNINNKFIGLSNTQFVENSVQEDDVEIIKETDHSTNSSLISSPKSPQGKENDETEKREKTLQCVSKSILQLERLCERLDISPGSDSGSDSQPEDLVQSIILKPKDSYSEKPLPFIIGTQKWQKKWHIGLHENSSESNSDNDEEVTKSKHVFSGGKGTDECYSSSEEGYILDSAPSGVAERKSQMSLPIPKTTHPDPAQSSVNSTSTNNSTDSEIAKINSDLKDSSENVADSQKQSENINKNMMPQSKIKAADFAAELARKLGGNISAMPINPDIPSNKSLTSKSNQEKTMSTKNNLDSRKMLKHSGLSSQAEKRVTGNIFLDEPPPMEKESNIKEKDDIFGFNNDDDDDDFLSDGLFSAKTIERNSHDRIFTSSGLFDTKKTPSYGGLFDNLPDDYDDNNEKEVKIQSKSEQNKPKGLFEESDDEDLFTNKAPNILQNKNVVTSANKNNSLFDDEFDSNIQIKKEDSKSNSNTTKSTKGLFDESDDDSDLFGNIKVETKTKSTNPKTVVKSIDNDIFKTDPVPVNKIETESVPKKTSIFNDIESDDDDLFAFVKKNTNQKKLNSSEQSKKGNIKDENVKEGMRNDTEDLFSSLRVPEKIMTNKTIVKNENYAVKSTENKQSNNKVTQSADQENIKIIKETIKPSISIFNQTTSSNNDVDEEIFREKKQSNIDTAPLQIDNKLEKNLKLVMNINENIDNKIKVANQNINHSQKDKISEKNNASENSQTSHFTKSGIDNSMRNTESKILPILDVPPPLEEEQQNFNEPRDVNSLFDDDDEDLFSTIRNIVKSNKNETSTLSSGLFDDLPIIDETEKKSLKTNVHLFSDEPPDLDLDPVNNDFDNKLSEDTDSILKHENTVQTKDINNDNKKIFTEDIISDDKNISKSQNVENTSHSETETEKEHYCKEENALNSMQNIENDLFRNIESVKSININSSNNKPLLPSKPEINTKPKISSKSKELEEKTHKSNIDNKKSTVEPNSKLNETEAKVFNTTVQNKPHAISKPKISTSKPSKKIFTNDFKNSDKTTTENQDTLLKISDIAQNTPKLNKAEEIIKISQNTDTEAFDKLKDEAILNTANKNIGVEETSNVKQLEANIKNAEKLDHYNKSDLEANNDVSENSKNSDKDSIKFSLSNSKSKSSLDVSDTIDGTIQSSLKIKEKIVKSETTSPTKTINKIQTNLNINVKALMPGKAPKLIKNINEERKHSDPIIISNKEETTGVVGFESEPKSLDNVLSNNWSKDKIKVQVKRRPQSRKARQEAARKSAADILFSFDETDSKGDYISSLPNSPIKKDTSNKNISNDESDFLDHEIITIGKVYGDKDFNKTNKIGLTIQNSETVHAENIFDIFKKDEKKMINEEIKEDILSINNNTDNSINVNKVEKTKQVRISDGLFGKLHDDLDLFAESKMTKKISLFGEDDDDDVLFSNRSVKKVNITNQKELPKVGEGAIKKTIKIPESAKESKKKRQIKNIFEDSDSDNDIFVPMSKKQQSKSTKMQISSPNTQPEKTSKKISLFGDSDTEDDLFSNSSKNTSKKFKDDFTETSGKSLFNDDDDFDIFKRTKVSGDRSNNKSSVLSKQSNPTQFKPLLSSAEVTTQDPLSSFFQDN